MILTDTFFAINSIDNCLNFTNDNNSKIKENLLCNHFGLQPAKCQGFPL